jgi:hypothetical protein
MTTQRKSTAYIQGCLAYELGLEIEDNPHKGKAYEDWLQGWYDTHDNKTELDYREYLREDFY